VPASLLPEVNASAADFGETIAALFGRSLPICSVLGDQQAALVGQACLSPGQAKVTFGTGAFLVANTGEARPQSKHRLLGTLGYALPGTSAMALEGSIFNAGTVIKWLRDDLKLIQHAEESAKAAASLPDNGGVYMVPAFTGLGAPYWEPDVRGALVGLTRSTTRAHLARAALEAVCYQTCDLMTAMQADGCSPQRVRIDGGMVANNWLNQFLADILQLTVDKPRILETTALGAAYLAGLKAGLFENFDALTKQWQLDSSFAPAMPESEHAKNLSGWKNAVDGVLNTG